MVKFVFALILINVSLSACHPFLNKTTQSDEEVNMGSSYDDSTLNRNLLPVLMPYNRIIDPIGKVISFGNPAVENHSMDVQYIPESTLAVVEDRYGITIVDPSEAKVVSRWTYDEHENFKGLTSTYSGIKAVKLADGIHLFWSAAVGKAKTSKSYVFNAIWDSQKLNIKNFFNFLPEEDSPLALPNDVAIHQENGIDYLYVVLNGNNQLVKINLKTQETVWKVSTGVAPYGLTIAQNKIFVSNMAGPQPHDLKKETAGVPYGNAYIDPKTGATNEGDVMVFDVNEGKLISDIQVGLHPNAIIKSKDEDYVYIANGNSDNVSVINTNNLSVTETINVKLNPEIKGYVGDSPNALTLDEDGLTLYVANGLDNAVAFVKLGNKAASNGIGQSEVKGFIPTEAYPGGLAIKGEQLLISNLEGEGARIGSHEIDKEALKGDIPDLNGVNAYNSHHQKATISIIQLPNETQLKDYTQKVKQLNLSFRQQISQLLPRKNIAPRPIPERIGEPSVFKHVLYIIKENRTYDQVLGDMPEGDGAKSLCIYGQQVTPNQHQIAKNFLLLDNYYASGKCSAEGHQWTDAAMVTDYIEKSVRSWFRSYPHVQNDALVYDQNGFIWNDAADHGKTVKIYGEACDVHFDNKLNWTDIYNNYQQGKPFEFKNTSTISRVRPMLSQTFPSSDEHKINEQLRASAFIKELKEYEAKPGDELPNLMVMALSADHTVGTRPGYPTPEAMVADNDLALGRIVEAVSKSRFWKNTVIFVTEDDSQAGWDHVSAYRTTGFVISPYSRLQTKVSKNYNQTCMVRSIEQILGIPPMNIIDATALPMFDCFSNKATTYSYTTIKNQIPLNSINPKLSALKGKALNYAKISSLPEYDHIDSGDDETLNRILWYSAKSNSPYPTQLAGKDEDDK